MWKSIDIEKCKIFKLYGEGANTYFVWNPHAELPPHHYHIIRMNEEKEIECSHVFEDTQRKLNPDHPFEITYISHCAKITVLQNGEKIELYKKEKFQR